MAQVVQLPGGSRAIGVAAELLQVISRKAIGNEVLAVRQRPTGIEEGEASRCKQNVRTVRVYVGENGQGDRVHRVVADVH